MDLATPISPTTIGEVRVNMLSMQVQDLFPRQRDYSGSPEKKFSHEDEWESEVPKAVWEEE